MIQAFNAAVAGLRVSAVRLGVAAENIVNVHSSGTLSPYDGYVPKRVVQTTSAHGLPVAGAQPVSNAFTRSTIWSIRVLAPMVWWAIPVSIWRPISSI